MQTKDLDLRDMNNHPFFFIPRGILRTFLTDSAYNDDAENDCAVQGAFKNGFITISPKTAAGTCTNEIRAEEDGQVEEVDVFRMNGKVIKMDRIQDNSKN